MPSLATNTFAVRYSYQAVRPWAVCFAMFIIAFMAGELVGSMRVTST